MHSISVYRPLCAMVGLLAILASLIVGTGPAAAVVYDFDYDPSTTGIQDIPVGSTGSWNVWWTTYNWTADGGANNTDWLNANPDYPATSTNPYNDARFGGTAGGVVTVDDTVYVSSITFNAAGYDLQSGWGSLQLSAPGSGIAPSIITNADATITTSLYGANGFTKSGLGTLILAGDNSAGLHGDVTITAGTLSISNSNQLGDGTTTNNLIVDGGTLAVTAAVDLGIDRSVTIGDGWATFDTANGLTIGGMLKGDGKTITKIGAGALVLNYTNNSELFNTTFKINDGTLLLADKLSLGSNPTLAFGGGKIGATYSNPFDFSASEWSGSPAVGAGKVTFLGDKTISADMSVTSGGASEAVVPGALTLASGVKLTLTGPGRATIGTAGDTLTVDGGTISGVSINLSTPSHAATKYIASHIDGSANILTLDGELAVGGNIVNTPSLVKTGNGTVVLNGTNSATSVAINGGSLAFNDGAALGSGAVNLNGGTLQVGWTNQGLVGTFYNTNTGADPSMATLDTFGAWCASNEANLAHVTRSNIDGRSDFFFPLQNPGAIFSTLGFTKGEYWTARFDGYLYVPADGDYNFWSNSDDGSALYIDDALVVNNLTNHSYPGGANQSPAPVTLTAGFHKITAAIQQAGTNAGYSLQWEQIGVGTQQYITHNDLYLSEDKPAQLTGFTSTAALNVTGASGIDLSPMAAASTASLGALTMASGAALDVSGAGRTAVFASTSGSDFSIGGSADVNMGTIPGSFSGLTKTGSGNLTYSGPLNVTGNLGFTGGTISGGATTVGGSVIHAGGSPATIAADSLNLTSGVVSVAAGNQLTITSPITVTTLDKQGDGKLILAPTAAQNPGAVVITGGKLQLEGASPIGTATITMKTGSTLVPGQLQVAPGLQEYYIDANNSDITASRPTGVFSAQTLGPRRGNEYTNNIANPGPGIIPTTWTTNNTWIYTGQFYDADGYFAFAENVDDGVSIWIDGILRLNSNDHDVQTTTGSTATATTATAKIGTLNVYGGTQNFGMGPANDGWHTIEIRFRNGSGGAGATSSGGAVGWNSSKGFGLRDATDKLDSLNGADYVIPIDSGSGELFRIVTGRTAATGLSSNNVVMEGDAAINLADALPAGDAVTFGTLSRSPGMLTIYGAPDQTVAFPSTTLATGGDMGFAAHGSINLGTLTAGTVDSFTKSGGGTLTYSGTLVATNGAAVSGGVVSSAGALQTPTLTMDGGQLNVATLQLTGATPSVVVSPTATGTATIASTTFTTGGAPLTLNVQGGRLDIQPAISAASVTKTGVGKAFLANAANAFVGLNVQQGAALVNEDSALGSGNVTLAGGTLQLGSGSAGLMMNFYFNAQPADTNPRNTIFHSWTELETHLAGRSPNFTALTTAGGKSTMWWRYPPAGAYDAIFADEGLTREDNYATIMDGKLAVPADGTYNFWTGSDDGSVLYIDGNLVVDNNYFQGYTVRTGSVALTAGWHDVRLAYYQGGGNAALTLESDLTGTRAAVPMTFLATEERPLSFVSDNPIFVTNHSTIDAQGVISGTQLGALSIDDGMTLTILSHDLNDVSFPTLTLPAAGGTVGLSGNANVALNGLVASTAATLTINSALTGSLTLTGGAAAVDLSKVTINVASGTTFGALATGSDASPLGGAAVGVGAGGTFAFGSEVASPAVLDSTIIFDGVGTIRHYGDYDGQLGDATHPLVMNTPAALSLDASGTGKFTLGSEVPANADSVTKIGAGTLLLAGAYNGGPLAVNAGVVNVNADNKLLGKQVAVNHGGTLDYESYSDALAMLQLNARGVAATAGTLSVADLQPNGGVLQLASGATPGKLVVSSAGITTTGGGSEIMSVGAGAIPGQVDISGAGANVFGVYDGPLATDFRVGAQIIGGSGLVKTGRGTLYLSGQNTFSGGISFSGADPGTIAINSEAALGDAGNVLTLSQAGVYNGTLAIEGVVTLADGRVNIGTGVGTIQVGELISKHSSALALSIGGELGNGQLIKTGNGTLTLRASADPATAPSSTIVRQGELVLIADPAVTDPLIGNTALGRTPTISVEQGGRLNVTGSNDMDLSGVTTVGWTAPHASNIGGQFPGWEWYAGYVQINSNLGDSADSRFPAAPITGVLHINVADLGKGGQLSAADPGDFSYLPKMADGSVLRLGPYYSYLNTRLDGDVYVRIGDGDARIYGQLGGTGGMLRLGGSTLRLYNDQTYTGPTIIQEGNTYIGDQGTGATAIKGKLSGSTDIRIMLGNLRWEDYNNTNVLDRIRDDAVISMYGGTFSYQSRNAAENSAGTIPLTKVYGGATIDTLRQNSGSSSVLTITKLQREVGGTVSFTGTSGLGNSGNNSRTMISSYATGTTPLSTTAITPWAYYQNSDWAIYDATNGVRAFTGYTNNSLGSNGGDHTIGAGVTVGAARSVNSLRMTAAGTLTVNADLTLASGGLLLNNNSDDVTIGGTGKLIAHDGSKYVEMVVMGNLTNSDGNKRDIFMNIPIVADGLTKSGLGKLRLRVPGNDFKGGNLYANLGTLEIYDDYAATADTVVSAGGAIDLRTDAVVNFGFNVHITNSTTQDNRHIHIDRISSSGGNNKRSNVGTLTIDPFVRLAQIRSGNSFSLSFGDTSIGEAVYLNLDGGTSSGNPWQFGVGGTVTFGDHVMLNLWNGDSEWGSLQAGAGTTWTKAGNGRRMTLTADAAPGYYATIDLVDASLRAATGGALGTNTGATSTTVNVNKDTLLHFDVAPTVVPTVVLAPFGAFSGDVGTDPSVFGVGYNKINLPESDAVLFNTINPAALPTVATRGTNRDWLGLADNGAAGVTLTVDPATEIFRGFAFNEHTYASAAVVDYNGSLASATGDLNIYMHGSRRIRPSSSTTTLEFNTPTGRVVVSGSGNMVLGANGNNNGILGNWTELIRYGNPLESQNWTVLQLDNAQGVIGAGKTITVHNGIVRTYNNNYTLAAGATLNIGGGATYGMWDNNGGQYNAGARVNFLADERGYGVLAVDQDRADTVLTNTLLAGVLNFEDGAAIYFDTGNRYIRGDLLPSNVNYILKDDDIKISNAPIFLGEGMRLSTSRDNNGALTATGGKGVAVAPGASRVILSAVNSRRLGIWDAVTFSNATIQIGDAVQVETYGGDNRTRVMSNMDGSVEFQDLTLDSTATFELYNGALRLGRDVNTPAGAIVINGLIDASVRPAGFSGGGPVLEINAGRDGDVGQQVTGSGKVRLGLGEDIQIRANEVGSGTGKTNVFGLPIEVLGVSETSTQSLSGGRGDYTGYLRSIRGQDQNANWALGRFSNVQPKAGAVVALGIGNDNVIIADFVLNYDTAGAIPILLSDNDGTGRVMIGNVSSASGETDPQRWLQLGLNLASGVEHKFDLVGTVSGKANLILNNEDVTRLTFFTRPGEPSPYTTFDLGGQTIEMRGKGRVEAYVDINGTINMYNAYLRLGQDAASPAGLRVDGLIDQSLRLDGASTYIEVHSGRDGNTANYITGDATIRLGRGEDIGVWANERDSGGTVNLLNLTVEVLGIGETDTQFFASRGDYTGLIRSRRGTDLLNDSALVRYTKVQLKAGARLFMDSDNEVKIMADFNLNYDVAGERPMVFGETQTSGRQLIGNVTSASGAGDPERWLVVGSGPMYGLDDGRFDLVGTLSGNANLSIVNRRPVLMTSAILAGTSTAYSTFNLGGRTVALEGNIEPAQLWVDPGLGNIDVNRGYMHAGHALDVYYGSGNMSGSWGSGLNINFNNDHHQRGVLFRVDDDSVVARVNEFTGAISVKDNGAGYLVAERNGADLALSGTVKTNVSIGANGLLSLRTGGGSLLHVPEVALTGSNAVLSIDSAAATVNRIIAATGVTNASATVKGTSPNLTLTGTGEVMKAQSITAEGNLVFNPGVDNTANVNTSLKIGKTMVVQTGTVDMGSGIISGDVASRPGGAQPVSELEEKFFRPATVGVATFLHYAGDPFVMFENTSSLTFQNTATPYATTLTGTLNYSASAMAAKANGIDASFTTTQDDTAGAWFGTITVGGEGNPIQPGWVTFGTNSDDSSTIYVDLNQDHVFQENERIVDARGAHSSYQAIGYTQLAAGVYDIGIGMANGLGGGTIEAKWGPGMIGSFGELTTLNPSGTFGAYNATGGIVDVIAGAELIAGAIRVDTLTIGAGASVTISPSVPSPGGVALSEGVSAAAVTAVPEPGSLVLLAMAAVAGLLYWRRRR